LFAIFVARDTGTTSNGSGLNVGIIVGAAVGGLVGILALVTCGILSYYCLRRDGRRTPRRLLKKRTTGQNLGGVITPPSSSSYRGRTLSSTTRGEVLSHYNPEPFSSRPSTADMSQASIRNANVRQGSYPSMMPAPTTTIMQPPTMSRYPNTSRIGVVGGGGGAPPSSLSASDAYSQFGSRYMPPPLPPLPQQQQSMYYGTIPPELQQKGSYTSVTSGSQAGSGYGGAPSLTSRSSYPILSRPVGGGGSGGVFQDNAGPSEPLPAYPVAGLLPRNDVKLKVVNP
jgi:hypothetical protein